MTMYFEMGFGIFIASDTIPSSQSYVSNFQFKVYSLFNARYIQSLNFNFKPWVLGIYVNVYLCVFMLMHYYKAD